MYPGVHCGHKAGLGADNSLSVDSLLVLKCVYTSYSIYICIYVNYTLQEGCGIIIVTEPRGHILLHA